MEPASYCTYPSAPNALLPRSPFHKLGAAADDDVFYDAMFLLHMMAGRSEFALVFSSCSDMVQSARATFMRSFPPSSVYINSFISHPSSILFLLHHHTLSHYKPRATTATLSQTNSQATTKQPSQWSPSSRVPTTSARRFSRPPLALPRRPTRTSPRTAMPPSALGKTSPSSLVSRWQTRF